MRGAFAALFISVPGFPLPVVSRPFKPPGFPDNASALLDLSWEVLLQSCPWTPCAILFRDASS